MIQTVLPIRTTASFVRLRVASLRPVIGLTGIGDRIHSGIGDRIHRNAQILIFPLWEPHTGHAEQSGDRTTQ